MVSENEVRDDLRLKLSREELAERIGYLMTEDGVREPIPGLFIARLSKPTESVLSVFEPALCFVVQGGKRALLGDDVYVYDPGHYLLYTVELPLVFQAALGDSGEPYIGFSLRLDPALVASVIMETGEAAGRRESNIKAIDVGAVDADLFDAVVRLIRLAESPSQAKILAPLVKREIVFRLLNGGQGARLSHVIGAVGDTQRISKAIVHLREHFDRQMKVDEVARRFGMSVSTFHQHFKSVTSMSPLQFQKQIRLQEARRLMLGDSLDAASAGFRVGYEDPAYFSRDYKKLFGAPPQRDIARLRGSLGA